MPRHAAATPTFSPRAVAALFLERQQLDRPRSRRLTASSLTRLAEDVGGIQIDSINVVERAHLLTLWSRFGAFDRRALERLVYRRRVLFEYWAHGACLVSTAHFPAWRRAMLNYRRRHKGWGEFLRKHPRVLRRVEEEIRSRGPLGSADFQAARPGQSGWWNWRPTTHVLDFLWMSGRTTVRSRVHFHKRFDLLERVLAEPVALAPLDTPSFQRWHLERSLHALGAATAKDLSMYLTFPRASEMERAATLQALLRSGDVAEIGVEGSKVRWYILAGDLDRLAGAERRRCASRGATLLSPFDSLLWYRERVSRLFGFDYRIEVYVPAAKRSVGYYALPLLVDGHLIGRVDAKLHRGEQRLELRHVCFEPWFAAGAAPPAAGWGSLSRERGVEGLAEAAWSLASFAGARQVDVGRVTPASMRAAVRRAIATEITESTETVEV